LTNNSPLILKYRNDIIYYSNVLNNTYPKEVPFAQSIKYVKFVKEIIGKDKLSEEFHVLESKEAQMKELYMNGRNKYPHLHYDKEFHPLFYLLWKVEKHIDNCRQDKLFTPTDDFTRLSLLGENLFTLYNLNVKGFEDKIKDLMSLNYELFDKTSYEIHIAAKHTRKGHNVEFIPTNSIVGRRSADLLIDDLIEIECKKKDYHSQQDKRNTEYWNQMMRKTFRMMDHFGYNYSIIINALKYPTIDDVKFITENIYVLLRDRNEGIFEFPNNGINIILQRLSPKNQQIEFNTIESQMLESFDYYIASPMQLRTTNDGKAFIKNHRFFAFKTAQLSDRIKSIIYSIKQAIHQLSGERPGIIYVDLNGIAHSMTERDYERLDHLINDILRNNSSVSMVILTAEFSKGNGNEMFRYDKVWPFENEHAKHRLPEYYRISNE
jgi:hypothetical protein